MRKLICIWGRLLWSLNSVTYTLCFQHISIVRNKISVILEAFEVIPTFITERLSFSGYLLNIGSLSFSFEIKSEFEIKRSSLSSYFFLTREMPIEDTVHKIRIIVSRMHFFFFSIFVLCQSLQTSLLSRVHIKKKQQSSFYLRTTSFHPHDFPSIERQRL